MRAERRWRLRAGNAAQAHEMACRLGVGRIAAQLLVNRGIADEAAARAVLQPDLNHLHDPDAHPLFEPAARRICAAIEKGERIVIYGDYDVDGISATSILLRCLTMLKANVAYYIPDRLEEGYGLNAAAIRTLAGEGASLLVTVDCGVTAVEEVALARSLGMDVIVTDHHEPAARVPADAIVIDPKLPGCLYPFRELSGAGLAFKLAWALGKSMSNGAKVAPAFREFLLDSISLAALGTIADVVPLMGENRTLACFGLRGLTASKAPGIVALRDFASAEGRMVSAFDVGFKLAPRLNAAGRLGSARMAVELLTTDSAERAKEIAAHLNRENNRRQKLQMKMLEEAYEMIAQAGGVEGKNSIVLAREGWHPGIVGIVAARLVETFCRPSILLAVEDGEGHGSARSIPGIHLFEALKQCSGRLIGFGGHARAAGLRLRAEEIPAFAEEFERAAAACLTPEDFVPVMEIDTEVRLAEVTRGLIDQIERLAPFGEGYAEPMLVVRNIVLQSDAQRMGETGRHLSFWVNQDGAAFRAVAFGRGALADSLTRQTTCSIAFIPRLNRWKGTEKIELDVRDIALGECALE